MYAAADAAVLVWSMGITQHERGADNVAAIVNLALARGNVGREGAGLMPIRGHSGVQGGSEMGAYATALPGGVEINATTAAALAATYGFPVDGRAGLTAEEMIEGADRGEIDVLYSSGGNFLEVLPDPALVRDALGQVPLRVHQDIVVSSQMLVDPGEVVVLLPAATRYEQRGGGTQTTTERRIAYSPEIPGPRPGEVRSEWEIFVDLASRVDPERGHLVAFESGQAIRDEIAQVVPTYAGVEGLRATGDAVQWGGTRLCERGEFPTTDGKAQFLPVSPSEPETPAGSFVLSTRRGKQFNTMVHSERDPLTGATRDALLMAASDAMHLGLHDGDRVLVRSDHGELHARVHLSDLHAGNVQVFFPEGNVLMGAGRRDPASGVPDYNAVVTVEPLSPF
jgi:molybdopterin-dependent oxidoreductase alpha subunit